MKIRTFATLLGIAGIAGLAASLEAAEITFRLDSISATVGANSRVTYQIAGEFTSHTEGSFRFHTRVSGSGIYDPASRRAQEKLVTPAGNTMRTSASCFPDPWLFAVSCTDSQIQGTVWSALDAAVFGAPVTAGILSSDLNRRRAKAAFDQALADKAAADRRAAADKWAADKLAAERKAAADKLAAERNAPTALARKHALLTPTAPPPPPPRPQYPPYGAAYSSNAVLASLKVKQTVFVPVTVRNLSSQTWPAGGAFRLAYHWYRGGGEIVHNGARTFMPAAVAPGASVTLNAKVIGPPSKGVATLRWDMVQENGPWFSDKGVAMSAPQNTTVTR